MGCPAAGRRRAGGVDGGVSLLDVRDLPVFVHHEGSAVGHPRVRNQYTIRRRNLSLGEIA